jgi:hypothetical protein
LEYGEKSRQVGRKVGRMQGSIVTNFVKRQREREREREMVNADADDGTLLVLSISSVPHRGIATLVSDSNGSRFAEKGTQHVRIGLRSKHFDI